MSWRKLQYHRPPERVVRRWPWEYANLGLLCGPVSGGLVVLDFDTPLGYHKWARAQPQLAQTYTVRTARGRHAYLYLHDLPPSTLSMEHGGDVKVTGYVVAPPSVHPSGRMYEAINGNPILTAQDLDEVGVALAYTDQGMVASNPLPSGSGSIQGIIQEIKSALPITLYLGRITQLYPSSPDGIWWMCCCPLHDDHRPSMWVNAARNNCRCFRPDCVGARYTNDVINLHALVKGIGNDEAIMDLAAEVGL